MFLASSVDDNSVSKRARSLDSNNQVRGQVLSDFGVDASDLYFHPLFHYPTCRTLKTHMAHVIKTLQF